MRELTQAESDLAARHFAYARGLARPFKARFPWLDEELEEAAVFGLLEAATKFDPDRGPSFQAFARNKIIWAIKDEIRSRLRRGRQFREALPEIATSGESLPDFGYEQLEEFQNLLDTFEPGIRDLIQRRVVERIPFAQLATEVGVSKSTMFMRIDSALRNARLAIAG